MAKYMLKHEGKLDRWCPVQADVDEYFRATLEQVIVIINPSFFCCFMLSLAQNFFAMQADLICLRSKDSYV